MLRFLARSGFVFGFASSIRVSLCGVFTLGLRDDVKRFIFSAVRLVILWWLKKVWIRILLITC